MLKRVFKGFIDFALPPLCLCCETVLEGDLQFICTNCRGKLKPFDEHHPWKDENINNGTIDDSLSLYWFEEGAEIRTILHSLKYEKMKSIGILFGKEIGESLKNESDKFDYVIPVPLHKSRQRERTYNQSGYICRGINEILGIEVIEDCLKRTRFTESQTTLDKQQRKKNIAGAFGIKNKYKNLLSGKNIILTDDVITTGATILECARILKSAGCRKLIICSIAYAELFKD
jgi:competence protein ComFC